MSQASATLCSLLAAGRDAIVTEWLQEAGPQGGARTASAIQSLKDEAAQIFDALASGLERGDGSKGFESSDWDGLREVLKSASTAAANRGASAADTSTFILALKRPIFTRLQSQYGADLNQFAGAVWETSAVVDKMSQVTLATYQRAREDVIRRQQQELLELSTPVVTLWEGVLAVPMIGTLDSSRTQLVMEALLQRIVDTGSEMAIIDITGVPTVDTLVAQHLLKTVTAIRLMGADCIISGIRPQIAQTIVHLGIDLQGITTKATLSDALQLAMKRAGWVATRKSATASAAP